ncbi:MAG: hypothetical protein MHM6MM_001927 [Cercozoa sp. M6MM]
MEMLNRLRDNKVDAFKLVQESPLVQLLDVSGEVDALTEELLRDLKDFEKESFTRPSQIAAVSADAPTDLHTDILCRLAQLTHKIAAEADDTVQQLRAARTHAQAEQRALHEVVLQHRRAQQQRVQQHLQQHPLHAHTKAQGLGSADTSIRVGAVTPTPR